MKEKANNILENIKIKIAKIKSVSVDEAEKMLNELKITSLGKKSELTKLVKSIGTLSKEERPSAGAFLNKVKKEVSKLIEDTNNIILDKKREKAVTENIFDITLPGRRNEKGCLHPLIIAKNEIISIFSYLGFEVAEGPEIENDFHNFEALNIPKDHPARDMQDTLYINNDILLRSHTSNVQIRHMKKNDPPIRIICPGRVYRNDYDNTHSPMFHQVEGLVIDEKITFADLKGTLDFFLKKMFGKNVDIRFRSSFFPFTEPSAEVDIQCVFCKGKGCNVCKGTGWLEIMGCGTVNPEVFKFVEYDPEKYTGYAFGMGIERIAMLKYGVNDLRLFFENDIRFLKQFSI